MEKIKLYSIFLVLSVFLVLSISSVSAFCFIGVGTTCDSCIRAGETCAINQQCCSGNCGFPFKCACEEPSNWINSPGECCGSKPISCQDKRCASSSQECGTCGCQEAVCVRDSDCCQNQCGLNEFMKLSCVNNKCQESCKEGYVKCPNDDRCVSNPSDCDIPLPNPTCKSCDDYSWSYLRTLLGLSETCSAKGWTLQWSFWFISPPQNEYNCGLSLVKLILTPIIFIFSFLFVLDYMVRFKSLKGNKKGLLRIILSLLVAFIVALLVYTVFIFGLIVFAIIMIIKTGLDVGLKKIGLK